jgi:hypothetical protein
MTLAPGGSSHFKQAGILGWTHTWVSGGSSFIYDESFEQSLNHQASAGLVVEALLKTFITLQNTITQLFHQLNVILQDILKATKALASARRKS